MVLRCEKTGKFIPNEIKKTKICTKCNEQLPSTTEYFRMKKERYGYILYSVCKSCESIFKQEYRDLHKDEIKEYNKYWNENNVEYRRKMDRIRYEIYGNRYYNKEKSRQWRLNNPDKVKIHGEKRRTLKKGLESNLTVEQWTECKMYFNNECAYCGKELPLQQDHFVPLSKGGEYTINNIIPACTHCNSSKKAQNFNDWYKTMKFYSKKREIKILKYLNYKKDIQQLVIGL